MVDLDLEPPTGIVGPSKIGISEFYEADVLSGRGGGTNVHSGNRDFRDLINKYRTIYLKAKKNDKPAISRGIVKLVRSRGGRFLKKNDKDNMYYEIGDSQAREKTSQALRQRAPEMRKLLFDQQHPAAHHIPGVVGGTLSLAPAPPTAAAGGSGVSTGIINPPHGAPAGGLAEEQLRMAMPLLTSAGMNPEFAAGLQAGMGFHHHHHGAAPFMGAYNPALFHAMLAPGGNNGMGFETSRAGIGAPLGHEAIHTHTTSSAAGYLAPGPSSADNQHQPLAAQEPTTTTKGNGADGTAV